MITGKPWETHHKTLGMTKRAIELCMSEPDINAASVLLNHRGTWRVKTTKRRMDDPTRSEYLISIGQPDYREREKIANIRKKNDGKVPGLYLIRRIGPKCTKKKHYTKDDIEQGVEIIFKGDKYTTGRVYNKIVELYQNGRLVTAVPMYKLSTKI